MKSKNEQLHLSGSNPRSVLFAVYDYLRIHGFEFYYPGLAGERIPENVVFRKNDFDHFDKADYPCRGMAAFPEYKKWEEAEELIDWMAKNKLNLYFLEGFDTERPGDKYSIIDGVRPVQHVEYLHQGKSWEERCQIAEKNKNVVAEARKRGMIIERGGHGWNFGVPEHYAANRNISINEARECLAAKGNVNTQADVEVGAWFQLCLSKAEVRDIYAVHIAEYLEAHQDEMDIAAVWVGDGYDNSCQCDECLKQPVSDNYLEIIRKVAERIAVTAPSLKIEAIIYFETLEAPTKNYLAGIDNIILNLAPWRQCHIHKLDDPSCKFDNWKPDYRHNKSHNKERDLRLLNKDQFQAYCEWRKIVGNELPCNIFNYITLNRSPDRHFMSYNAKNLVRDINDFDKLNFSGMVPCQINCQWDKPANLQLFTMARVLWNKQDCNSDKIRRELFSFLYRDMSEEIIIYCDNIYELLLQCDYHHSLHFQEQQLIEKINKELQEYLDIFENLSCNSCIVKQRLTYFSESLKTLISVTDIDAF